MPDRHGPMRSGRFTVAIDDVEVAGFAHVTIPSNRTEGDWGQTTHDDLVMERAVLKGDSTLREWRDDVLAGKVDSGSRSVAITLQDEEGEPQIVWEFADAWIREYEPPELVATEDDQGGSIATETIRVAFDELNRVEG